MEIQDHGVVTKEACDECIKEANAKGEPPPYRYCLCVEHYAGHWTALCSVHLLVLAETFANYAAQQPEI